MRRFVLVVSLVGALVPRLARADAGRAEVAEDGALVAKIQQIVADRRIPGAAVALATEHGVRAHAVGWADRDTKRAATRDTPFRVASVSKLFVALVVLALVDEGKLSLDTRLRDALPGLPFSNAWEGEAPITVRDLCAGSAGWDDLRPSAFVADRPRRAALAELLREDPRLLVSRWRPGTYASYTNAGTTAAAAIVEEVERTPFEDSLRRRLLAPLGMTASTFDVATDPRVARAYRADGTALPPRAIAFFPAAGLASSAADMGRFLSFLLAGGKVDGRPLLAPATFAKLLARDATPGAREGLATAVALATRTAIFEGRPWRGHHGGFEGAASDLFFDPERKIGYFVAIDVDDDAAFDAIGRAVRHTLDPNAAAPPPDVAQIAPLPEPGLFEVANPRFSRASAVGSLLDLAYVSRHEERITIATRAGHPARGTFFPAGGRTFRRADEPVATLVARSDGALETSDVALVRLGTGAAFLRLAAALGCALVLAAESARAMGVSLLALRTGVRPEGPLMVRVAPTVAAISIVVGLLAWSRADVSTLGQPSAKSIVIFVASTALPLASIATLGGLGASWKVLSRRARTRLVAVVLALAVACAHFARYDLLFVRSWE